MRICKKCGSSNFYKEIYCRECARISSKKWKLDNVEKKRVSDEKYRMDNRLELKVRYLKTKNNLEKFRIKNSFRYGAKVRGTPRWANREMMQCLYQVRNSYRLMGLNAHVDHIIPLRSKIVCGLHVEHNLQLILGKENSSKGNRRWPDMPLGE